MSDQSAIEWTDATWNPIRGCSLVSEGCRSCYAMKTAHRFSGPGKAYEGLTRLGPNGPTWTGAIRLVPEKLGEPQHWKQPKRVFVNSMSDLFQDGVPDEFIAEVWKTMATIRRHTYQVLTKREDRMRAILPRLVDTFGLLPNVWLGVSVENQHFADERIPFLLQTPAAVRFISAEPLLGPIDFGSPELRRNYYGRLDWVIVGGESGPGARLFRVEWARAIIAQCQAAGVPCFMKQLGDNPMSALGLGGMLRASKGGDPDEWPDDLRVREFPKVRT